MTSYIFALYLKQNSMLPDCGWLNWTQQKKPLSGTSTIHSLINLCVCWKFILQFKNLQLMTEDKIGSNIPMWLQYIPGSTLP